MKKRYLRAVFNVEYVFASLLVLVMTAGLFFITDILPNADDTSFLSPILNRIDFINIEDVSLDAIFAMKDTEPCDTRLVIVNIGEMAPAPDGKIAALLYKLKMYGARSIGIDVLFDQQHFERFPPERQQEIEMLKQALRDVPNVVLANGFDEKTQRMVVGPDPSFAHPDSMCGFVNLGVDDDGVVRKFQPYITIDGVRHLSLPVRLAQLYDPALTAQVLALPEQRHILAYASTYDQMQTVPIDDVITKDSFAGLLHGAIVIVGFVQEGGLYSLDDTHRTPMAHRTTRYNLDGSTDMGVEGPDMPGVLIHGNVVNMLLTRRFITPVPAWADWLIAFALVYISIVVYRLLRVRVTSSFGVGLLITSIIMIETVLVFFLPVFAYFELGVKISYNIMATGVMLFVPANALTTRMRFVLLRRKARRICKGASHMAASLERAFEEDQPFIANVRLQFAALRLVHFACACESARRLREGRPLPEGAAIPDVNVWRALLPAVDEVFTDARARHDEQYFFRYLDGRKLHLLRDSAVKQQFFATQKQSFNAFVDFEEWELLLPYVIRLYVRRLRPYLVEWDVTRPETLQGGRRVESVPAPSTDAAPAGGRHAEVVRAPGISGSFRVSPFCEVAECKIHRTQELFVFTGIIRKQTALPPLPVYMGVGVACEPVLPPWTLPLLAEAGLFDPASILD